QQQHPRPPPQNLHPPPASERSPSRSSSARVTLEGPWYPRLHIAWPPARSAMATSGRTATANPSSTSATPTPRATQDPLGSSFSAAIAAEMSSTQGRLIAPAATRTTISAQQHPRQ